MKKNNLSGESETLFLSIYGKALLSREYGIIDDKMAEKIVQDIGYEFPQDIASYCLYISMGMRASIMDDYTYNFLKENPGAAVIQLGCGLDGRICRIKTQFRVWYDLDLPEVIKIRKKYYSENEKYRMISSSVTDLDWLNEITFANLPVLVIAEGLFVYLKEDDIKRIFIKIKEKFNETYFILDAFSKFAIKASHIYSPVGRMGAVSTWGLNSPDEIENYVSGIKHLETKRLCRDAKVEKLRGLGMLIYKMVYTTEIVRKNYGIYVFSIKNP